MAQDPPHLSLDSPGVRPAVRASDAEREAAAARLRDHCAAGRIAPDELADRLDQVYASKTVAELEAPFGDLPASAPPPPPPDAPAVRARRRLAGLPGGYAAAPVVVGVVAVAAVADVHQVWLAWPLLVLAGRHRRFRSAGSGRHSHRVA